MADKQTPKQVEARKRKEQAKVDFLAKVSVKDFVVDESLVEEYVSTAKLLQARKRQKWKLLQDNVADKGGLYEDVMAMVRVRRVSKWAAPEFPKAPEDCVTWMNETESTIKKSCCGWMWKIGARILYINITASVLSLGPIVWPFGNPYDLTLQGFINNTGYFVGYTGIGWSFIWLTSALWAHRLLNIHFHLSGAVVIPTIFSILIFLGVYIVLGGPTPLGTLSLGGPCFVVSWITMWKFMISKGQRNELGEETTPAAQKEYWRYAKRLILVFAAWVVQLCTYAVVTVLLILFPEWESVVAINFVLFEEALGVIDFVGILYPEPIEEKTKSDDDPDTISIPYPNPMVEAQDTASVMPQDPRSNPMSPGPTHDQILSARVLQIAMFFALHITYQSFLFPVLTDLKTVLVAAITSFVLNVLGTLGPLVTLSASDHRGQDAADSLSDHVFFRGLLCIVSLCCPVLFPILLLFDHYAWNKGMFYVMSDMSDEQIHDALVGCGINLAFALLYVVCFAMIMKSWLSRNSQMIDPVKDVKDKDVDLSRYTVLRALWLAKHNIDLVLGPDTVMFSKMEERSDNNRDKMLEERKKGNFIVPRVTRHHEERGLREMLIASLGAVTTVVGVCMVMKHDGMALEGWTRFLFEGALPPYPLCPMLGDCFDSINTTLSNQLEEHVQT